MINKTSLTTYKNPAKTILKTSNFAYIHPHNSLKNHISNYSITFPQKGLMTDNYTVLPHASATLVYSQNSQNIQSQLFGPSTLPCTVGKSANQTKMIFIIEFQPGGLYTYTKEHQSLLTDKCLDFALINPTLNHLIRQTIEATHDINTLINNIDNLLIHYANITSPKELNLAIQNIIQNPSKLSVKELSNQTNYSQKQLNRIFYHHLGTNIKTFSRIVRINKALTLLQNQNLTITNISSITNYTDLPHFVHDFKKLCNLTPQEYRNNHTNYYSEIAKY